MIVLPLWTVEQSPSDLSAEVFVAPTVRPQSVTYTSSERRMCAR
jgi:hypothetical protein